MQDFGAVLSEKKTSNISSYLFTVPSTTANDSNVTICNEQYPLFSLKNPIIFYWKSMLKRLIQSTVQYVRCSTRACLKIALCQPCVTICGRFVPHEGAVAGYSNRIRGKSAAKWGVWVAWMNFQTRSSLQTEESSGTCGQRKLAFCRGSVISQPATV